MYAKDMLFLTQLLNGRFDASPPSHNAELAELSPRFQPVARQLLLATPHERPSIWDEFLAGGRRPEPGLRAPADFERAATPGDETSLMQAEPAVLNAPTGAGAGHGRRVRMTCAVDLKPQAIDWLWAGRVPVGMITMFAGDPKLGKSYVTLAMAAALSRGVPLPLSDQPDSAGQHDSHERRGRPRADDSTASSGWRSRPREDSHPRVGHPRKRSGDPAELTGRYRRNHHSRHGAGRLPLDCDRPGFGVSQRSRRQSQRRASGRTFAAQPAG